MMTQMTASTAFNPQVYYNQHLNFQQQPTGTVYLVQGGRGQLAVNYISPQNFIIAFSYSSV